MNMPSATVDHQGKPVAPGDMVRVLGLSLDPDLDDDDRDMFNDMLGSTCQVERIDADGAAWVAVWWNGFEGPLLTSVGLMPGQMEKLAA